MRHKSATTRSASLFLPHSIRQSSKNRVLPKVWSSRSGWFLLCALAFPAPGHAITKVNVSNGISGLSVANQALNITSNGYPILEFTRATNTTGTIWFGATHGETTAFGRAEVGKLRISAVSK